jgi:hypothetical protein
MDFCDMNCIYAEWPEDKALDGSSSCRTFQAIFCRKEAKAVYKNGPCMDKKKRPAAESGRGYGKKTKSITPPQAGGV